MAWILWVELHVHHLLSLKVDYLPVTASHFAFSLPFEDSCMSLVGPEIVSFMTLRPVSEVNGFYQKNYPG